MDELYTYVAELGAARPLKYFIACLYSTCVVRPCKRCKTESSPVGTLHTMHTDREVIFKKWNVFFAHSEGTRSKERGMPNSCMRPMSSSSVPSSVLAPGGRANLTG